MRGNLTRRGKSSWRLKFDIDPDPVTGKRQTQLVTVRGKRQDAERELTRLLNAADAGTLVEPSKITVAEYLRAWLGGAHGLSGKTAERYGQLAEQQIIPRLGHMALQALRPVHVEAWHAVLLKSGGKDGAPLSARTVGHAHRVLHRLLARAVTAELVARNVASAVKPPKVEDTEIASLKADEVAAVLAALQGHPLEPIGVLALATGARRGEILGLRWGDINIDAATLRIARSLEQTKAGLTFKPPKTKAGARVISLPPIAMDALTAHRRRQLELRLALGRGKLDDDALVFTTIDDGPLPPNNLSRDWWRFVQTRNLPRVSFHALRHSHASALIASGIDPVTVSRRIGHASVSTTLNIYAHKFAKTDAAAAKAIEAALTGTRAE
jgi:integrase